MQRLSQSGSYGFAWIALFATAALVAEGAVYALVASACVWGTLALNTAVKLGVRRPRPEFAVAHAPRSYSFPSAHTSMAVVGATAMTLAMPALTAAWWAFTVTLAITRVMLGAHYAGDVLAGLALGALVSTLVAAPLLESL